MTAATVRPPDPPWPSSPEDAVRWVLDAGDERRWRDIVRLGDDDSLCVFHRRWLGWLRDAWARRGRLGEALEFQFVGVETPEELERLSPSEAAVRWLAAHDPVAAHLRRRRDAGLDEGGGASEAAELATFFARHAEVLGHVPEAPDLAHVVYLSHETGWTRPRPPRSHVASVRRQRDGGWRVVMDDAFLHGGLSVAPDYFEGGR